MCITCNYNNYDTTYEKKQNDHVDTIHEQQLGMSNLLIRFSESSKTYKLAIKDDPKSEFVCNRCPTCGKKLY